MISAPCRVGRVDGRPGCRAAIDGDDELRPFLGKSGQRRGRRSIALGEAVGDVGCCTSARGRAGSAGSVPRTPRHPRRNRRRWRWVQMRGSRARSARAARSMSCKPGRIRQELAERRIEIVGERRCVCAPRGEQTAEQAPAVHGLARWPLRRRRVRDQGARPSASRAPTAPRRERRKKPHVQLSCS